MWNLILYCVGYLLIWAATDVGRPKEYGVKLFTNDWFFQFILIVIGVMIINSVPK